MAAGKGLLFPRQSLFDLLSPDPLGTKIEL